MPVEWSVWSISTLFMYECSIFIFICFKHEIGYFQYLPMAAALNLLRPRKTDIDTTCQHAVCLHVVDASLIFPQVSWQQMSICVFFLSLRIYFLWWDVIRAMCDVRIGWEKEKEIRSVIYIYRDDRQIILIILDYIVKPQGLNAISAFGLIYSVIVKYK